MKNPLSAIFGPFFKSIELAPSASRHLVKGIARAGNGTSVFSNEGEDLRPKVMGLLKNALQPAISDVKVVWKDTKGSTINYDTMMEEPETETKKTLLGYKKPKTKKQIAIKGPAPSKLPPIYDGQRLLAFCLFSDKENPVGVKGDNSIDSWTSGNILEHLMATFFS